MPRPNNIFYNGNRKLKKAGIKTEMTSFEVQEFIRCKNDPVYFCKNYCKIVDLDNGIVNFDMWDFQEDMMKTYTENRFVINLLPRQMGKSITTVAFCLHTAIFQSQQSIGVLANKAPTARKILQQAKRMYENLPFFLQVGVVEWNKGSIELGNGSAIVAESGNSDAVRGFTFNTIVLDEFAFLENAEDFYTSTYPVISSGSKSKVIIISTPNGMNLFYKMWEDAKSGRNEYVPVEVNWWQHPRRDKKWAETARKNMGKRKFGQEFGNEFHGSSGTLISGEKLAALTWCDPIIETENSKMYEKPVDGHSYIVTVDVSEGVGQDYSVINVTDITETPYKQVMVWRSNEVIPLVLPEYVERIATQYNDAFILVEVNSCGAQVSNILWHDYEYENMVVTNTRNQQNVVSGGFGSTTEIGIRMTKKSKRIGCTNIKGLIENDIYLIRDFTTINELQTFVQKGISYEAEDGKYDDVVMTLVSLGWISTQDYFKDLMDVDNRKHVMDRQMGSVVDDLAPLGSITNGELDRMNTDGPQNGITDFSMM